MGKRPPCWKNGVDCPNRRPGCQSNCKELVELHDYYAEVRKARDDEMVYLTYAVPVLLKNMEISRRTR